MLVSTPGPEQTTLSGEASPHCGLARSEWHDIWKGSLKNEHTIMVFLWDPPPSYLDWKMDASASGFSPHSCVAWSAMNCHLHIPTSQAPPPQLVVKNMWWPLLTPKKCWENCLTTELMGPHLCKCCCCTVIKIVICVKNSVELNQCEIRLSGESRSKHAKYSQLQMLCYGIFPNETIILRFG